MQLYDYKMADGTNFKGIQYRLASNWYGTIPLDEFKHRPIRYMEIGTFYGGNALFVAGTYGLHPDSEIHCVDPWDDYSDYPEYKGEQLSIYNQYLQNLNNSTYKKKIHTHRGYSNTEIPKFEDESLDIIYIDGNHEPEFIVEDGVLAFRKLKKGGYMIFDDYGWQGPDMVTRGVDAFISGYHKRIQNLGIHDCQAIVKKIR